MSWREMLGVKNPEGLSTTQNTQNTQKPPDEGNSVYFEDSEGYESKLMAALVTVCKNLPITPFEVRDSLAPEDIKNWHKGEISINELVAYTRSLVQRREMDQGKVPTHYTKHAACKQCGPIWLWFSEDVIGCPWCWNRVAGRPIPRP